MGQKSFKRGVFVFSLDFELVWGSRDLYPDPTQLLEQARITRSRVFEPLLALFQRYGVVGTWATVGSLFLDQGPYPGLVLPKHSWKADWLAGVPEGSETEHPEFYAKSLVLRLIEAGQEIGSHSFTHPVFGGPGCSVEVAESELQACVRVAESMGIRLKSFVFPRNVAGHSELLKKYGFSCWRSLEPLWYRDERVPGSVSRLAHLAEVVAARTPPPVMPFQDVNGLWCIPASCSFLPMDGIRKAIPISRRVKRCIRGLDRASEEQKIMHLYLHPINLAAAPEVMLNGLEEVLKYAAQLRDKGKLEILSMGQVANLMSQP
jgi:hypothetical protein